MLAGFTVNTTLDTVDVNPGDGVAADASGNTSLRAAIMEANALAGPDVVTLPAGNYTLGIAGANEDLAATGDLDVLEDLTINGAGETQTTINAASLDRAFHVLGAVVQATPEFTISGVTITNGFAPGVAGRGGGILGFRGIVNVQESTISGNRTGDGGTFGAAGGGIYVSLATLTVTDSTIFSNSTGTGSVFGGFGGGIGANVATVTITGSDISFNRTGDGSSSTRAGGGAGIDFQNGNPGLTTLTISDSTIFGNTTGTNTRGVGGGIRTGGKTDLFLQDSQVSQNTGYNGGGIILDNGTAQLISNTTISGNTATGGEGGGGIHLEVGRIVLMERTTISGNRALNAIPSIGGGGGIFSQGQIDAIVNSTISGNITSGLGGGIASRSNLDLLLNTTIVENTAQTGGGLTHVSSVGATNAIDRLENTLIANNTATGSNPDFELLGFLNTARFNLIESAAGHPLTNGVDGNIVGSDPQLGGLLNNGGPTSTHALLAGSPAINAGLDSVAPAIDQRGVSRPAGAASDIGAYEFAGNTPPVANDLTITIDEDTFFQGNLPGQDPDGDTLTYTRTTAPTNGVAGVGPTGQFNYVPDFNFFGSDSFTYEVDDGNGGTSEGTVFINVTAVNDAPFVDSPFLETDEDTPLSDSILFLDVEGDSVTFVLDTGPSNGTVSVAPGGSFTYTPDADFNGVDSFIFSATDGMDSRLGTVTIDVHPVNDAPIANDDAYAVDPGATLTLSVAPITSLTMVSEPGDFVGAGLTYSFDPSNAVFDPRRNFDDGVRVIVDGTTTNDFWDLEFAAPFAVELGPGFLSRCDALSLSGRRPSGAVGQRKRSRIKHADRRVYGLRSDL